MPRAQRPLPRGAASLRLVTDETEPPSQVPASQRSETGPTRRDSAQAVQRASRRAVTQSNVESAYATDLDPQDPRWLVAVETASQLEGSLLSFERRERVLAFAARVGVRTFDANLIIAAVQDRARRGEPLESTMSTVALAAAPRAARARGDRWLYVMTALAAIALHALLGWAILRFAFPS